MGTVESDMEESGINVLVSVCVSIFFAMMASASVCSVSHDCVKARTCAGLEDGWCSFTNVVSPAGYRIFNTSTPVRSLQALERGVCPWGERQTLIEGELTCLRQRSFPSALNTEIMDPNSGSQHRRYCGRWLDSQSPIRTRYWSLFDAEDVAQDVSDAIASRNKIRNAVSNAGKFRSACVRMVTSNSGGPAGQIAYAHLKELMPVPTTREELITIAGVLPAHYCDAPAMIGVTYRTAVNGGLAVNVTGGTTLTADEVSEQLYAAGESRHVMAEAAAFAASALASDAVVVTMEDVDRYVTGSVRGTVLDGTPASGMTSTVDARHLARFLAAAESKGVAAAHAYVLGLAATCAYAVRSVVTGEMGLPASLMPPVDVDAFEMGHTATLGRLPTRRDGGRVEAMSTERMLAATSTGWSALHRKGAIANHHKSSAVSACNYAMATAFADELDTLVFNYLVPGSLYARIEPMHAVIREAVRVTVLGPVFAPLFADPASLSNRAATSVMRVAGAPRGSWAGRTDPMLTPGFESRDGSLVMLLKQARAVFVDRIGLALFGRGVVQHPPLMASSSRNAYMIFNAGVGMLLPGILVPPFAGADYDDVSLYSRIGYVIAHEIAHVTAAVSWNEMRMASFLSDLGYAPSEYTEAIADVIAVSALLNAGVVDNTTMCASVSQLWCAKDASELISPIFGVPSTGSHPPPNARGNRLCAYISKHYR